jgi:hypothetical protein
MTSAGTTLSTRNATLADMAALLQRQHADKLDVVVPAAAIHSAVGDLHIAGTGDAVLSSDGVTTGGGVFTPTGVCDAGIAEKLSIPLPYLRRLRERHIHLYDANVNTWLGDDPAKKYLLRTLRGHNGYNGHSGPGIARALLSDSYRVVDNLDVLLAVLAGIRDSGADTQIVGCDLTERRMYLRVQSSDVAVHAPTLLANYTSPFTGNRGADNPLVFAGFVVTNSEVGHGSFSITPRIIAQVCRNGMTITRDAMREVHLGGRLPEGIIRWSPDTQQAALTLVTRQAADAVATFLDHDYVHRTIARIEENAGIRIRDVQATVEYLSKELRFTEAQTKTILEHFIDAGDRTAGGILHAITSAAQTIEDADTAHEIERSGLKAMNLAAAHQH